MISHKKVKDKLKISIILINSKHPIIYIVKMYIGAVFFLVQYQTSQYGCDFCI